MDPLVAPLNVPVFGTFLLSFLLMTSGAFLTEVIDLA